MIYLIDCVKSSRLFLMEEEEIDSQCMLRDAPPYQDMVFLSP